MKNIALLSIFLAMVAAFLSVSLAAAGGYAIVVKEATLGEPEWAEVVDALQQRYGGEVFTFALNIWDVQDALAEYRPSYVCVVSKPLDSYENFVRQVQQLTRALDDDPYGDALYGIVTGYTPEDALGLVTAPSQFPIKTAVLKTAPGWLKYFYQGLYFSEATYNRMWIKYPGGIIDTTVAGPTDCTDTLVTLLNANQVNIFVTSGHASDHDWQLHYPEPGLEGFFRSNAGQLYGDPYSGPNVDVNSTNLKVNYAPGNCLIGRISDMNCMVLAWIHTGGAYQYIGYLPLTWYGYMGWGCFNYFGILSGQMSYAEGYYANNQSLLFDLANGTPGTDPYGLQYDRDAVAFYGDPALRAWIVPDRPPLYERRLTITPGEAGRDTMTFSIRMNEEAGLSRHPLIFLPYRVANVEVVYTDAHEAIITDDFAMLYCWYSGEPGLLAGEERTVVFAADRDEGRVSVLLLPDTTVVEQGGILGYTVTLINTTPESRTFYGQAEVTLPGGEQYAGNPVLGPTRIVLGPGQLVERHIEHHVPGAAPTGFYVYTVKIGTPSGVWDEGRFQFQVTEGVTEGVE